MMYHTAFLTYPDGLPPGITVTRSQGLSPYSATYPRFSSLECDTIYLAIFILSHAAGLVKKFFRDGF